MDLIFYFVMLGVMMLTASAMCIISPVCAKQARSQSDGFFHNLEGLRGLLACSVVIHHAVTAFHFNHSGNWAMDWRTFLGYVGPAAVYVFFFLTGFLFWTRILNKGSLGSLFQFYRSRFFRLAPAYFIAVMILLLFTFAKSEWVLNVSVKDLGLQILDWLTVGMTSGSFSDINNLPSTRLLMANVAWSLKVEILFYAIVPVLVWFAKDFRLLTLWLLFAALPEIEAVIKALLPFSQSVVPFALISGFRRYFLDGFFFGILSAFLFKRFPNFKFLKNGFVGIASLVLFALMMPYHKDLYSTVYFAILWLCFLPFVYGNTIFGFLNSIPMQHLGRVSYGIYLYHAFFLNWLFSTELRLSPDGIWNTQSLLFYAVSTSAAIVTVVFSTAVYIWIEMPLIAKAKNFGSTKINKRNAQTSEKSESDPAVSAAS